MSVFRGSLRLSNDEIWKHARLRITECGLSCVGMVVDILSVDSMWATYEWMFIFTVQQISFAWNLHPHIS